MHFTSHNIIEISYKSRFDLSLISIQISLLCWHQSFALFPTLTLHYMLLVYFQYTWVHTNNIDFVLPLFVCVLKVNALLNTWFLYPHLSQKQCEISISHTHTLRGMSLTSGSQPR